MKTPTVLHIKHIDYTGDPEDAFWLASETPLPGSEAWVRRTEFDKMVELFVNRILILKGNNPMNEHEQMIDREQEGAYHLARHLHEKGVEFLAKFLANCQKIEKHQDATIADRKAEIDRNNIVISALNRVKKEQADDIDRLRVLLMEAKNELLAIHSVRPDLVDEGIIEQIEQAVKS